MKTTAKALAPALKVLGRALSNDNKTSRTDFFKRYMGEPYGDEKEGRSGFLATDVSDVVETVFGEGMAVLFGTTSLVSFSPSGPDDEADATQETAIVDHQFRKKNNAFTILSTWFKEGLIEQNAYVHQGWQEKRRVRIDEYKELTWDQFAHVMGEIIDGADEYDVEEISGGVEEVDGEFIAVPSETGEDEPISIRVRSVFVSEEYEIEPVPQSEMRISSGWNKVTLDGCPAHAWVMQRTPGALRAMGFHPDDIELLSKHDEGSDQQERHSTEGNDDTGPKDDDTLTIVQSVVQAEVDGEDRLLHMWTTGDGSKVIRWKKGNKPAVEEIERTPFTAWTPYIVPHRHVGRSVAELAAQIQLLKTALWRHTLDNMYGTNFARPVVAESLIGDNTYSDLEAPEHGAPIRVEEPGAIEWQKPQSILAEALPLMDRADGDLEKRSGATRYAQGLDADALGKGQIGSEGVQAIMDASQRRMQMVLKTFAETGLRDLFLKMHADMRRGPVRDLAEQINGEWVEANPLEWRERTDLTVHVGDGQAYGEAMVSSLMWVLSQQKEHLAAGAPNVTGQHVYEVIKAIAKQMGLPSVDRFIGDPAQMPPPPEPQPNPQDQAAMLLAQAELKKAEAALFKAETDRAKEQAQAQIDRAKIELERLELRFARKVEVEKIEIARDGVRLKAAEVGAKLEAVANE